MMKNQKGITLIALVITIIVLLILAGVSIAMLTGDNGLLTKARESQTANIKAEVLDKVNMELNAQMANAMAGDKFDAVADITKNLDLTDGKIGEYTITVTTAAADGKTYDAANYSTDNIIKITVGGPSSVANDFDPVEGTVTYDSTNSIWKVTPIKLKK